LSSLSEIVEISFREQEQKLYFKKKDNLKKSKTHKKFTKE